MLGIDAGDTQTTADVLYRVANQVDGRNENRELCGIQDVAREEAHRNTDAAAHAQKVERVGPVDEAPEEEHAHHHNDDADELFLEVIEVEAGAAA